MMSRTKQLMLLNRLVQAIPIMILATFLVFSLLQLVPGDVAITIAGENASEKRIQEIRELYGLNQPFLVQYGNWLVNAVQGDFGESLLSGEPVLETISRVFPNTLFIVAYAVLLSVVIGVPLGIMASSRPNSKLDGAIMGASSLVWPSPTSGWVWSWFPCSR